MATTDTSVGLGASLKPRLIKKGESSKKSRIYGFSIPKLGRFAFSRDNGEASLFFREMVSTNLSAIHRGPDRSIRGRMQKGEILGEYDLGSGKVTNVGVTALANDSNWLANTTENLATLNVLKFMNWGTGTNEGEAFNWKLQAQAENESGKKEAVATSTSALKFLATGNSKIIVTGTLEALGVAVITEWGLFSAAKTEGTTLTLATGSGATSLTDTVKFIAPGNVASAKDVRGAQQYVLYAKEDEEVYGLVLKNTTEVATVAGWVKNASATAGATPKTTSKYAFYPVMFDRRKFEPISLEKGNKIEFPYELEIKSGG